MRAELERVQRRALIAGGAGLAALLAGALLNREQFLRSYLVAYLLWVGLALGCFALLMLHHMVGGDWGFVIRRVLEAATRTFPALAALALPILIGAGQLYEWARPGALDDELLRHKAPYLNLTFFRGRAVLYFAVWIVVSHFLNRWSHEQDQTGDPLLIRRLQFLSGPGLLLYGLTVTFASVDWAMSLEPQWFSTMYGVLFMVGQALTALAFVIVVTERLARHEPLASLLRPSHYHDLGNLMLAFVMLWAYMSISQFLIIWSGNLPEEIPWYLRRIGGGWQAVSLALVAFHFAIPFLVLLTRGAKRRGRVLASVAVAMLLMRCVDMYWLVAPAFQPKGPAVDWMDAAAVIGVGGLWVAAFIRQLKTRPLVPQRDLRWEAPAAQQEGLEHGSAGA